MEFTFNLINLFSTLFLCGLIWTIQLVHYPIFFRLEQNLFGDHLYFHGRRISLIVIPVMTAELVSSGWLALLSESNRIVHSTGLLLVVVIWIVTFTLQVPLHARLLKGYDKDTIRKLVRTNWIRTLLWSIKAVLALLLLFR